MDLRDLPAHGHPLLGVQVAQRFVHQEDAYLADQGPADGHALPLAAGKRPWQAVQILRQAQDLRGLLHPFLDHVFVHALQRQAEGDVIVHCHLRIQRVALEHHGHFPVPGALFVRPLAVDQELAAGNVLQPGDHPQRRGFSAAGRPDKHHKLTLFDLQAEIMHRMETIRVDLIDVLQLNIHQACPPHLSLFSLRISV